MLSHAISLMRLLSSSLLTFSSTILRFVSSTLASPPAMILCLSSMSITISSLGIFSSSGAPEFFSSRKSSWALICRILSRISFFFTAFSAMFISCIADSRTSSYVLSPPPSASSPSRSSSFRLTVNLAGGPVPSSCTSTRSLDSRSTVPLQLAQARREEEERQRAEHPPCHALKARSPYTLPRPSPDRRTIFPPPPPDASTPSWPPAMCSTTLSCAPKLSKGTAGGSDEVSSARVGVQLPSSS
mmetsp:Transcript_8924/g.20389  ORF Transcript_8924/g.20389 Transcript_8924/m.20389 type:complete len:243 (-) Transcript_8924:1998-2726(-)